MSTHSNFSKLILLSLLVLIGVTTTAQENPEKWDVLEFTFETRNDHKSPFEVELGLVFSHEDGSRIRVPGFYNGDKEWVVRFCPPETGDWSYLSYSSDSKMAGKEDSFSVTENTKAWQKGPLMVSEKNPQKFIYADGTPYFLLAFELDWLFALDAQNDRDIPKTRQIISTVAEHGYNQIVMNVYAYDAGWGEKDKINPENNYAKPDVFPFGGSNEDPDYSTLNVEFFKRLDRVIEHLNEKKIVSHLMIYVWNKMVNWPVPGSKEDNRYFDYVVKRYQAYPNLIWDISKEALAYGRDDMSYITERIERLRQLDGHKRLVTVHDYNYCKNFPGKVDIISIQEWAPYLYYKMRDVLDLHEKKPVFNIEHGGYEKTMHSIFNGAYTDPVKCLDRNYQCIFAGTYSTYYWQNTSWYNVVIDPFSLKEENQPHFDYYQNLVDFFSEYEFNELTPRHNHFAPPMLSNEKDFYIYYISDDRLGIFGDFPEFVGRKDRVKWFDPLTGEFHETGEREFNGTWVGIKKPSDIEGPMGIAVVDFR